MGQKGHIIDQKGLKIHEKRQKIEFSNLKYLLLAEFSLAELGGTPLPLKGKSSWPKTLSGNGEYPPPLTEKIRSVVFDSLP